jgi:hypothetical protein
VIVFAALTVRIYTQIRPSFIQTKIVENVESSVDSRLSYDRFSMVYFPLPGMVFQGVRLTDEKSQESFFAAEQVKINLRLLPMIIGQIKLGTLSFKDASAAFAMPDKFFLKKVKLERLTGRMTGLNPKENTRFEFYVKNGKSGRWAEGKIDFVLNSLRRWDWVSSVTAADLKINQWPLENFKKEANPQLNLEVQAGTASGRIRAEKSGDSELLRVRSEIGVEGLVYQVRQEASLQTSPALNTKFRCDFVWNARSGEMEIKSSTLSLPVASVDVSGRVMTDSGEFKDMRARIETSAMEKIPHYWFSLADMIPSNVGFSGQSALDLSLSGTWDHLTFHGNWDLKDALLNYGVFFSKGKDVPLLFSFDYLLKKGRDLSGDFSLKFEKAKMKGTVRTLDLESGKGQINMITNKFSLAGWDTLIPFLKNYQLDGTAKFLINLNGSFRKASGLQPILNMTLDGVKAIHRQTGTGIQNLYGVIDYGIVALKIKQLRFDIQGSPFEAVATFYNFASPSPVIRGRMSSPYLVLSDFWMACRDYAEEWLRGPASENLKSAGQFIRNFFPPDEPVKNFSAEFAYKAKKWNVPKLEFELYDGWISSRGGWDTGASPANYWTDVTIDHLRLARLMALIGRDKKLAEGNLFAKIRLKGIAGEPGLWAKNLTAEGEVSLTNGEFHTFDLLGALGKMEELKTVNEFVGGKTVFHDLQATCKFQDGKVKSDYLYLLAGDLSLKAAGEILADGMLNYRAEVYLSKDLTRKVLTGLFPGYTPGESDKQLGPIPVLISGSFENPEVKIDPAAMPHFRNQLMKKGSRDVLNHFLPEELFFERRNKS